MYAGIIEGSKMVNVGRRNREEGRQVWVSLGVNSTDRQRSGVTAGGRRGAEWDVGTLGPLALGLRGGAGGWIVSWHPSPGSEQSVPDEHVLGRVFSASHRKNPCFSNS